MIIIRNILACVIRSSKDKYCHKIHKNDRMNMKRYIQQE